MIKHIFTIKLFKDADIKSGAKFTTFKFGIPEQKYAKPGEEAETKWHNVTLFAENGSKQADFYTKNLVKGAIISGEFAMQDREYDGKTYTDCIGKNIDIISYAESTNKHQTTMADSPQGVDTKKEVFQDFNLDL